jgi:ferredoxin
MPNRFEKSPRNAAGPYYVDSTCIDCDMCREIAPAIFARDEENGSSYVFHQPETAAELEQAEEARKSCPAETIGNDG